MTIKTWQRTPPILTPQNVKDLRREYDANPNFAELARRWKINKRTCRNAVKGLGPYKADEYNRGG